MSATIIKFPERARPGRGWFAVLVWPGIALIWIGWLYLIWLALRWALTWLGLWA